MADLTNVSAEVLRQMQADIAAEEARRQKEAEAATRPAYRRPQTLPEFLEEFGFKHGGHGVYRRDGTQGMRTVRYPDGHYVGWHVYDADYPVSWRTFEPAAPDAREFRERPAWHKTAYLFDWCEALQADAAALDGGAFRWDGGRVLPHWDPGHEFHYGPFPQAGRDRNYGTPILDGLEVLARLSRHGVRLRAYMADLDKKEQPKRYRFTAIEKNRLAAEQLLDAAESHLQALRDRLARPEQPALAGDEFWPAAAR